MSHRVSINGQEYELVPSGAGYAIVVLDRGFIVYGRVTIADSYVTIRDGASIRRWGTKHGLGQLAKEGPQKVTVLDPQPTTRVHEFNVVQIIECEGEAWEV